MLKISVAMAAYNGSEFIEKQLNSILSQIRQPDEVIITDDCSTDNTAKIIEKFIEDNNLYNWRLIRNDSNLGFKKNFYKAISLTTGDIIFTCDQDDIWFCDKTESITGLFAKYDNALAVSTTFLVIDKHDQPLKKRNKRNFGLINTPLIKPLQKISLRTVMHSNISPGCTSAFRRSVADMFLKNTNNTLPHDYEINLIAAAQNGLYFYNIPLVQYRIHDNNNTLGLEHEEQTRIDIASEKCEAAEVVMNTTANTKIYDMFALRLSVLNNCSLKELIKLGINPLYRNYFNIRTRIGDLIYVLRSGK